jgi:cytochrome c oxidase assembly factor CtaG
MWWPLVRTCRTTRVRARAAYLRGVSPHHSVYCSRCCHGRSTTSTSAPACGASALTDQEIAGVTMASEQAVVLFVVFLYWFRRFLAEEGAT